MELKWTLNIMPSAESDMSGIMSVEKIEKVMAFHRSFPQYAVTPLARPAALAKALGLSDIFIKDESYRFGLNAFKVLGSSYAIGCFIAERAGVDLSEQSFTSLCSDELRSKIGELHFFTATDGNHGRGVAWAARQFHHKASVLMPKGTTERRFQNIISEGAECTIENMNYDDCVRMASKLALQAENGVLIQDTAWEGYEKIPCRIMQGYGTMAAEAANQLRDLGCYRPTHIFLQAGVGSMAGAVAGYYVNLFRDDPPKIIIVEADAADCHMKSALYGTGEIQKVDGEMETIMAGLACGEPNPVSWSILRQYASAFVSISDDLCKLGMRILSKLTDPDIPITSGESGAAGFAALVYIMQNGDCSELRDAIGLCQTSKVLLFSTEGDTDPDRFKEIVNT